MASPTVAYSLLLQHFPVHNKPDLLLIHLNHTLANPMAEKEHFRLSTVSRTASFPVTPGTLYLGFQTSSWQKDHYWGKFRLTFGIDSKKTFSPLAKVTFVGLWLHLLGENYNERKWSSHSSHTSLPIDSFVSFRGSPLSQGVRCPFFPGNPMS